MKLPGSEKILVGYDLDDSYAQISYVYAGSDNVQTVASIAGTEIFNIPAVLCKKAGTNQWLYGREALKYAREDDGILVDHLLSMAVDGEPVQIDGQTFRPLALLTLFFKRSLSLLAQTVSTDRIEAMMFTCESLDGRVLEVLSAAAAALQLKTDRIFFQNHKESFYYYMLRQPGELWLHKVLLFEYREGDIRYYQMDYNQRTRPVVVSIAEGSRRQMEQSDSAFLELLQETCEGCLISAAYLIGEDFSEEWMKESLRYLCRGRRVFQGNNLYSKGACFGLMERMAESDIGKGYVLLGPEKLKYNIGMRILRRGQESYFALLDAGINWYEAEKTAEFYLQDGNVIELLLTAVIGGTNRLAQVVLEGLAEGISRLRISLHLTDETHIAVRVEDLGFGEFRPASQMVWEDVIELQEIGGLYAGKYMCG